jgi:TPR repeat protein
MMRAPTPTSTPTAAGFAFVFTLILALCAAAPAQAESGLKYYQDPLFTKIAPTEPHPMDDMISLAAEGDARAEYILGDLYGKGQGGLGKNLVKSRYWFEIAARNGYGMAFIRLAALAKHAKDPVAAYKWYTLGKDFARWNSDEYEWCDTARDNVAESFKMTGTQIRAAKKAAGDWKDRQGSVEQQLRLQEAKAREDAAKAEAAAEAEAQKAQQDNPAAQKTTAQKREKTPIQPQSQPEQENHYND